MRTPPASFPPSSPRPFGLPGARPWRVAIVGAGISGMAAAHRLVQPDALAAGIRVTLFEREPRPGGHANTVDVTLPSAHGTPVTHGVDTGFLVYNERTYPQLIRLFASLGVATTSSDMSFSVQSRAGHGHRGLEWSGSNLNTVFAQRGNLVSLSFWSMLRDVVRFNRLATSMALHASARGIDPSHHASWRTPLIDFLAQHRFGEAFRNDYLLPMIASIWSCPVDQMLRFPVGTLIQFCHNHGLLQVSQRPRWLTVQGGSRHYVDRLVRSLPDVRLACGVQAVVRTDQAVLIRTHEGTEAFDEVVFACHAPQTLKILSSDAHPDEASALGALKTQPNRAVLHTDTTLMPRTRRAWAAWNFERGATGPGEAASVCLHYWINRLQPLPFSQDVMVTLNPVREPDPRLVLGEFDYDHPVFDLAAMDALAKLPALQGRRRTWFAGAWSGYGFHEDGLRSGLTAAEALLAALPKPTTGMASAVTPQALPS